MQLYKIIHPGCKIETTPDENLETNEGMLRLLKSYIETESNKQTKVHIALQSMLESQQVTENILKSS